MPYITHTVYNRNGFLTTHALLEFRENKPEANYIHLIHRCRVNTFTKPLSNNLINQYFLCTATITFLSFAMSVTTLYITKTEEYFVCGCVPVSCRVKLSHDKKTFRALLEVNVSRRATHKRKRCVGVVTNCYFVTSRIFGHCIHPHSNRVHYHLKAAGRV